MAFIDLASERYSERRFAATPIEEEKLAAIVEAGRVAPTAENFQPQRILLVTSPEGLAKIDEGTSCRFGAPAVALLAYDTKASANHPDVCDFGGVDLSIVATHMMLEAQDLGIHSCWVGLIDPSELRRQFDVPASYRIMGLMDFGYPKPSSRPSRLHRKSKATGELFFRENYDTPFEGHEAVE